MASIPLTSFTPPIKSPPNASKSNMFHSTLNSNFLPTIFRQKSCFVTKISKSSNGSSLAAFGCSTTSPFIGKVGLQRREGNFSLLSFGTNPSHVSEVAVKTDSSQILSATLPFVVALSGVAALSQPSTFTWVSKELYAPTLGGIVLSIGIKLSIDDFALAFKRHISSPCSETLGVLVARAFNMSPMVYAGFVLTACVAGAQLSSYASFLSKGDVALSILLTSLTTIASVLVTPLLTGLLIGSVVVVNAVAMSKSILQVVLVPVTFGLVLNTHAKPVVNILRPIIPFVAMICTSMCVGSPLAINRNQILSAEGLRLVGPVLTFHAVAFTLGNWISKIPFLRYWSLVESSIIQNCGISLTSWARPPELGASSLNLSPACFSKTCNLLKLGLASPISYFSFCSPCKFRDDKRYLEDEPLNTNLRGNLYRFSTCIGGRVFVLPVQCWRQEEEVCRTISPCTGMQSSTLAGLLATQFLGCSQAVPPACSVVAMAIMGLCLASFSGSGSQVRDLPFLLMQRFGVTDQTIY